ncbi:MAG: secondary thiamine-phosphate synthase enzyme YjbQ [Muribaculaceae bacterium]|nr:secondary thiamine-phosphate synthase enzyme YjbQ [Muribaculaceae bacterium]
MIEQIEFRLPAKSRGCHLVTDEILRHITRLPEKGILNIFVKHTSCGLSINENADPDVRTDLAGIMDHLVPERQSFFEHTLEGDDDMPAHAKSSIFGVSLSIPISNHRLNLGTWQGIYLCEFRNYGGERTIVLTVYS